MKRLSLSVVVCLLSLGCGNDGTAPIENPSPTSRLVARRGPYIVAFNLDGSNMDTVVTAVTGASLGSPR